MFCLKIFAPSNVTGGISSVVFDGVFISISIAMSTKFSKLASDSVSSDAASVVVLNGAFAHARVGVSIEFSNVASNSDALLHHPAQNSYVDLVEAS